MKYTILFLLLPFLGFGQELILTYPDCGILKSDVKVSDWETVDTLGKRDIAEQRDWVESEWHDVTPPWRSLALCYHDPDIYQQFRICRLTGIKQRRTKVRRYWYEDPPLTEFQLLEKEFQGDLEMIMTFGDSMDTRIDRDTVLRPYENMPSIPFMGNPDRRERHSDSKPIKSKDW